jgi:hypothetical protein
MEFDKISGTSNNQRGVSDRTTATEANTIETRSRVREDSDRNTVAEWLCAIGKEMLQTIIENFSGDFFIKMNSDGGEIGDEVKVLQDSYQRISANTIDDGVDYDISINVQSMSPVVNQIDEQNFLKFMAVLQNYPILSLHPAVIREAAYKCGYRNEKVIQHLSEMARLAMMAKIAEGEARVNQMNSQANAMNANVGDAGTGANQDKLGGGNMAQQTVAPASAGIEQIRQQVNGQASPMGV